MIKRFKHNFHTHTIRCSHAVDEDEKYIEVAIENGLKTFIKIKDDVVSTNGPMDF